MKKSIFPTSNFNSRRCAALRRNGRNWFGILDYVVETGPPKDAEKSKQLRDGIFEFRTKGGLRLLWFYDEGRVGICVNGYIKQGQKTPRQQIEEAIQWKDKYFEAKHAGKLKDITPK